MRGEGCVREGEKSNERERARDVISERVREAVR